jgi:predicted DNA-binding helix-hairpin-helix protein
LKTIAEADPELIRLAGRHADRLSVNVELPSEQGLTHYAPEKSGQTIRKAMADIRHEIDNVTDARSSRILKRAKPPAFAPGGQSTQMIVGADTSSDADILHSSARLYAGYGLKRVYYSAYSPVPEASADLPPIRPPLIREHRLYQADWMFRFYGFSTDEITSVAENGMLDLDVDPKLSWALRNRGLFPMDINRASYRELLRIPGLGPTAAKRIIAARRHTRLTLDDLARIVRSLKKIRPFVTASGWSPGHLTDAMDLKQRFLAPPKQMDLFG